MRFLVFFLLLISVASALELPAEIIGQASTSGPNCLTNGGPYGYTFSVSITNPSARSLKVYYSWYDFSKTAWSDNEVADCHSASGSIEPGKLAVCDVKLYPLLGGLNGTAATEVSLIGEDGASVFKKGISVWITHTTTPYEDNIVQRINEARGELGKVNSRMSASCSNGTCCGMKNVALLLSNASVNITDANTSLMSCKLGDSWSQVTGALAQIDEANQSMSAGEDNCATLSGELALAESHLNATSKLIKERLQCGATVSYATASLGDAATALQAARAALLAGDYSASSQELEQTNTLISRSMGEVPSCPVAATNASTNQSKGGNETTVGQVGQQSLDRILVALIGIVLVIGIFVILLTFGRARRPRPVQAVRTGEKAKKEEPAPLTPEEQGSLEGEFEEWLKTQKKKEGT